MSASTQKKKHIKAVRPKLRAKEPLLGVFMWGINYSASIFTIYTARCYFSRKFMNFFAIFS